MHKKLLSIVLGTMLTLSAIVPVSAESDFLNDGIDSNYLDLGTIEPYDNFDYCINENAIRLGGRNRFETNKKVINEFYPGCTRFTILESDWIHRSLAVQAITADQPMVLASVKSDKSVLNGADELLFVYFEDLHPNIESSCLAGAAGKGVYNAYETLYKKLGDKRNDICYTYNPNDNYVDKESIKRLLYIRYRRFLL